MPGSLERGSPRGRRSAKPRASLLPPRATTSASVVCDTARARPRVRRRRTARSRRRSPGGAGSAPGGFRADGPCPGSTGRSRSPAPASIAPRARDAECVQLLFVREHGQAALNSWAELAHDLDVALEDVGLLVVASRACRTTCHALCVQSSQRRVSGGGLVALERDGPIDRRDGSRGSRTPVAIAGVSRRVIERQRTSLSYVWPPIFASPPYFRFTPGSRSLYGIRNQYVSFVHIDFAILLSFGERVA